MLITDHFELLVNRHESFIIEVDDILLYQSALSAEAQICLQHLSELGKRVTLIQNSAERSQDLTRYLQRLGLSHGLFQLVITSGEEAYRHLLRRSDPWHSRLGNAVFLVASPTENKFIDELDLRAVASLEEADFILALDGMDESYTVSVDWIDDALALNLPLVAANPTAFQFDESGVLKPTSGMAALAYASRGGECFFHGLPYPRIFQSALKFLSPDSPEEVLVITSSSLEALETCHSLGLATALVPSLPLLHSLREPLNIEGMFQQRVVEKIYKTAKIPHYFLSAFQW